ncbi:sodium-dependent transporter [Clostridium uliginosum]|uniref:Neurotransmitter:Na+ symporter, NSS family n=1 Tax=Clostridium uliginosum TaxID=119641 RepID=A0A1I1NZH6_9CLOT|nr:sodium-dependent transporter [Clostridium uliginosum]SFD02732.1 neurotransmitter:Na+ symporter, NSS family [Clostridium uliginosum]
MESKREKFSSGLTVFLATLSSAVGLGNIWMFPYVTGKNGGAAFIIIYLICVVLVGMPVLISEFIIGRGTRKNVYGAISTITNKKKFKSIGVIAILATYSLLFFYTVVVGWVYSYVFKALVGSFKGVTLEQASNIFNTTSAGAISSIIWQFIAVAVGGAILVLGVKGGIEKLTKTLMPVLVILLVVCAFTSLTLPGSMEGVKFLIKPDFSKVHIGVVLSALGLAFFKLSVGTGTMITYGSYYTDDNNLIATASKVAISDTIVSLLAGLAIFPAVFSFGMEPSSGPGLLFNTVPLIFSKMPGGWILSIIFFLLTSMAATMAMISLLEVLIVFFNEELKIERKKAVIINIIIITIIGSLAALSGNPNGVLGNKLIFGKTFFDLFDLLVSKVFLPVNGFLIILLVGYFANKKFVNDQLTNNGTLNNEKIANALIFIMKYIAPVLIVVVFLKSFI